MLRCVEDLIHVLALIKFGFNYYPHYKNQILPLTEISLLSLLLQTWPKTVGKDDHLQQCNIIEFLDSTASFYPADIASHTFN